MSRKVPFDLLMHHVGIFVTDMEKSLKWYEEVLGFTLVQRNLYDLPGQGPTDMAWIKNGNYYIELYQYTTQQKPFNLEDYFGTIGTKHVCFYVKHEEYQALKEHLTEKGANIIVDIRWPNDQTNGPIKPLPADADPEIASGVIYVTDPDGLWVEIIEEYYPGVGPKL